MSTGIGPLRTGTKLENWQRSRMLTITLCLCFGFLAGAVFLKFYDQSAVTQYNLEKKKLVARLNESEALLRNIANSTREFSSNDETLNDASAAKQGQSQPAEATPVTRDQLDREKVEVFGIAMGMTRLQVEKIADKNGMFRSSSHSETDISMTALTANRRRLFWILEYRYETEHYHHRLKVYFGGPEQRVERLSHSTEGKNFGVDVALR